MRGNMKVKLLSGLLTVMTLTAVTGLSQSAHADVSWADILKPLVTDLVVPTMKKGFSNWQAKHVKASGSQSVDSSAAIDSASVDVYADPTETSMVDTAASTEAWKLPEEPTN